MFNKNSKFGDMSFLGSTKDGNTVVMGDRSSKAIDRIYIEGSKQFARNDFNSCLYRYGEINRLRNSDFLNIVTTIFEK